MPAENTDRLSTKDRWDASYVPAAGPLGVKGRCKRWLRKLLGENTVALFKDYDQWLLWEVLYPKFLPRGAGLRVLEIGSAPGTHLIELHRRFGYEPFGVEYTPAGAELNRARFAENGIPPENVIEADVFSEDFCRRYQSHFDVVFSRGLIEHFKDPDSLVRIHLQLLKPGGTLMIEVPNFRGIYYPWYLLFRRSVLTWHNFGTMKQRTFQRLCELPGVETNYSGSYGTMSLNMFMLPANFLSPILAVLRAIPQAGLNCTLRLLFKRGGPETALCSPHRLYIGVKR